MTTQNIKLGELIARFGADDEKIKEWVAKMATMPVNDKGETLEQTLPNGFPLAIIHCLIHSLVNICLPCVLNDGELPKTPTTVQMSLNGESLTLFDGTVLEFLLSVKILNDLFIKLDGQGVTDKSHIDIFTPTEKEQ